ncbi:MAG: LamG domain-containing protein [Verrucomicrobiae bacterium]|nr:LamG domain-containing protein [Verrucomicrobiae bacterium]
MLSRRAFVERTGSAVVTATLAGFRRPARANTALSPIPPHRALAVPGVHAYALQHSIPAGGTLELCVSSSVPYRLSICRLGRQVDDPAGDAVLARFDESPPNPQPIHPGSYIHVEKRLTGPLSALTLECWARPAVTSGFSGLITQYDYKSACGVGLMLCPGGVVGFYLGDGRDYRRENSLQSPTAAIKAGQWYHVVGTWDGREKKLWINGKLVGASAHEQPVQPGPAPLRLAAYGENGRAMRFLDGDLAMPAIYNRALSEAEINERFAQKGLKAARGEHVIACWPLTEEKGDRVADASGQDRHGRIINHATWMIGGPGFNADVPRFTDYDPKRDPTRGHGLRFASDDLYDCHWRVTHRWKVPADARQGLYVARMEFSYEGKPRLYHYTFIVRRPARRQKAPLLVLCATNTWLAYGATPFAITPPELAQVWTTQGIEKDTRGLPAYSFYRKHASGLGTYQLGWRIPWPAAGPYVLYGKGTGYSHLARADRFVHIWLEEQGYQFDLISDMDLHRDPGQLRGYKAFMIAGHNEYWSWPMYRGVEDYLRAGGNLIVLSGNTMFWRVSYNDDCTVMECRKVDAGGAQVPDGRRGEAWHSHDGLRGGTQRECGMPGYRLIALDIIGWNVPSDSKTFGPYVVEDEKHFLFNTPEKTGLKNGEKFGWAGEGRPEMANVHEMDIRPSTFAALQEEPTPPGAVLPTDPPGIVRIANGITRWKEGGRATDYFGRVIKPKTEQGGEMIYWERPDGGRVFNAGAIGSGWVLHCDPRWAAVVRNVLHHFGVRRNNP